MSTCTFPVSVCRSSIFLIPYLFLLSPGPLALCYTKCFSNLYLHLHHHFPNLDHHLSPGLSPLRNLYIHPVLPCARPPSLLQGWLKSTYSSTLSSSLYSSQSTVGLSSTTLISVVILHLSVYLCFMLPCYNMSST